MNCLSPDLPVGGNWPGKENFPMLIITKTALELGFLYALVAMALFLMHTASSTSPI